jgi:hypothetical protein
MSKKVIFLIWKHKQIMLVITTLSNSQTLKLSNSQTLKLSNSQTLSNMSSSSTTKVSSTVAVVATKPCYAFFGRDKACGDKKCRFSHDLVNYKSFYNLKDCPNKCGSFCKVTSKNCSSCWEKIPKKVCFFFFGTSGCTSGDQCKFSHDSDLYLKNHNETHADNQLKYCPNGCVKFCKLTSKQCSACVESIKQYKQEKYESEFPALPSQDQDEEFEDEDDD